MKTGFTLALLILTCFASSLLAASHDGNRNVFSPGDHHNIPGIEIQAQNPAPGILPLMKKSQYSPETTYYQWDTVVCYDTLNRTIMYTRTFNSFNQVTEQKRLFWKNGAWADSLKWDYTYDAGGYVLTSLQQRMSGGTWNNYLLWTYTYDSVENLTVYQQQRWTSGAWVNLYMTTYVYSSHYWGLPDSVLVQQWSGTVWTPYNRYTYTYDSNEDELTYKQERYSSGSWNNVFFSEETWDISGHRLSYLSQTWQSGAWVNSGYQTYSYNAHWDKSRVIYYTWNGVAWDTASRLSYTYNTSYLVIESLTELWSSGVWSNSHQDLFNYDGSGNLLQDEYQTWNGTEWNNSYRLLYTWDAYGNSIQGHYETWRGGAFVPYLGTMNVYTQQGSVLSVWPVYWYEADFFWPLTGIGEAGKTNSVLRVYPNPAVSTIHIDYSNWQKDRECRLTVFSMDGRLMTERTFSGRITSLDISGFSEGIYILKVVSDGRTDITRFSVKE